MRTRALLTKYENRVLGLILAGRRPARIARRLGVSIYVLRNQIVRIKVKFGAMTLADIKELAMLSDVALQARLDERDAESRRHQEAMESGSEARQREQDLTFYRLLSGEDAGRPCRSQG